MSKKKCSKLVWEVRQENPDVDMYDLLELIKERIENDIRSNKAKSE